MIDPHEENFWKAISVERFAAEQGIEGPQSLDKLIGAAADLWSDDEEFERYVTSTERHDAFSSESDRRS
ncbi:MAG TPA: hypothetical protein VFC78_10865 [Tepidisphaeraceae bacterium]|nr:hypothetical protein [Tepidisphaeraceae bacterium]